MGWCISSGIALKTTEKNLPIKHDFTQSKLPQVLQKFINRKTEVVTGSHA